MGSGQSALSLDRRSVHSCEQDTDVMFTCCTQPFVHVLVEYRIPCLFPRVCFASVEDCLYFYDRIFVYSTTRRFVHIAATSGGPPAYSGLLLRPG
jgi:hypothetical protein